VVLSHDTSSCSCIFVALPPPSDAVLACWCVWTPVCARLCVYSTSRLSSIVVLLFCICHSRHSLAGCSCCVVVVVVVVVAAAAAVVAVVVVVVFVVVCRVLVRTYMISLRVAL
jgi:hypothetical protein